MHYRRYAWLTLIAAQVFLLPHLAMAAATDWTGTNSNDWFDAGNWDNGVPGGGDDATVSNDSLLTSKPVLNGAAGTIGTLGVGGDPSSQSELDIIANGTLATTGDVNVGYNGATGALVTLMSSSAGLSVGGTTYIGMGTGSSGEVDISSGAQFNGVDGYVGDHGTGTLSVDGSGSAWNGTGDLYIGEDTGGNGTLHVSSGGVVNDANGFLGNDFATGFATVDGAGSQWNNSGLLRVTIGTLGITNGGAVTSAGGAIGTSTGPGSVVVDGSGSSWISSGDLYIGTGSGGDGSLTVSNGGSVTAFTALVGFNAGSGTLTVEGAGSSFVASTGLINQDGQMTIESGGAFESGSDAYIGTNDGHAVTTVTGAGSVFTADTGTFVGWGDSGQPADGTLSIESGAVYNANGDINVADALSTGEIDVTGGGSLLDDHLHDLYLGNGGLGTMTIDAGGVAKFDNVTVSQNSAASDGSFLTVSNGGGLQVGGTLSIGNISEGDMTVESGGTVTATGGGTSIGNGSLTVENANSLFDATGQSISVGVEAASSVTLDDHAILKSGGVSVGHTGTTGSTITVENHAQWQDSADFYVGDGGDAAVTIESGGAMTVGGETVVGEQGTGSVTVDGAGSTLGIGTDIKLGDNGGDGTLNVTNGGGVTVGTTVIVGSVNADGHILVDGAGSSLAQTSPSTAQFLIAGVSGSSGDVTVSNGGSLTGGQLMMGGGVVTASSVDVASGGTASFNGMVVGNGTLAGASATVTIESGGEVTSTSDVLIGDASLGASSVTVTGSLSSLNAGSHSVVVGDGGVGTLTVSTGAVVQSGTGIIGNGAGSSGSNATVSGNAAWNDSNEIYVGANADATLDIESGGKVDAAATGYIGYGFSIASTAGVSVDGGSSEFDANGLEIGGGSGSSGLLSATNLSLVNAGGAGVVSDVGYGAGTGEIDVDGGSTFSGGTLHIGNGTGSTGTFSITNQGQATTLVSYIGLSAGVGTATVDGAGSAWDAGTLVVGYQGAGSLIVSNDGAVTADTATIGYGTNPSATATVESGGTLSVMNTLEIGNSGPGELDVLSGGQVTVGAYVDVGIDGGSGSGDGTLLISGAGSSLTQTNAADYFNIGGSGSTGLVTVDHGASLQMQSLLLAGGTGELDVLNGSSASYAGGYIGAGGAATVLVSGGAALTSTGDTFIASGGTANVTVTGSGSTWDMGAYAAYIGYITGVGTVTLDDSAATTAGTVVVGYGAGAAGSGLTVKNAATLDASGDLYVGVRTDAALTVESGGQVTAAGTTYIAFTNTADASTSTVTVTGSGSQLNAQGGFQIGNSNSGGASNGTLSIQNGGAVTSGAGTFVGLDGGTGDIDVDGAGSSFSGGAVALGSGAAGGGGTISITNGGDMSVTGVDIGQHAGLTATVTVDGSGSQLTASSAVNVGDTAGATDSLALDHGGALSAASLTVGNSGVGAMTMHNGSSATVTTLQVGEDDTANASGTLTLDGGSTLDSTTAFIGHNTQGSGAASGSVRVSGLNSLWTNSGALGVAAGANAAGTLQIDSAGSVHAGTFSLGSGAGAFGTLVIGAASGDAALAPGTLAVSGGQITTSAGGAGEILFNHTSSGYNFSPNIIGSIDVEADAGTTTLTGAANDYGDTNVFGGALNVALNGQVTTTNYNVMEEVGSAGAISTIDGAVNVTGATEVGVYNSGQGGSGEIDVAGGTWTGTGATYIGYSTGGQSVTGTFSLSSGATGSFGTTYLGVDSAGTLNVGGTGTSLSLSGDLTGGSQSGATANFNVTGGATVDASVADIMMGVSGGTGTLALGGANTQLSAHSIYIGDGAGATGFLTVGTGAAATTDNLYIGTEGGTGSATLSHIDSSVTTGRLYVGGADMTGGQGTFNMSSAAVLHSSGGHIGTEGAGTMDVNGASWLSGAGDILIGSGIAGDGSVTLENGTSFVSASGDTYVGMGGAQAQLIVENGGTSWTQNDGDLLIGYVDAGTPAGTPPAAVVSNGATMSVSGDVIAGAQGTGSLTLDGAGTALAAGGALVSGADSNGHGSIIVSGGATASAGGVAAGFDSGSGTIEVTGAGSSLTSSGGTISGVGTGALTLNDGGVLNVGADPLSSPAASGAVLVSAVNGTGSGGTVNFNHTDNDYTFAAPITGNIDVNVDSGTTVLSQINTYTGATTINGGALIVDGSTVSTTTVGANGLLGGLGSVGSVINNGTLAPGAHLSAGAFSSFTVAGDYTGNAGSKLTLNTVLGDSNSLTDRLVIDGGHASGATTVYITNEGGLGGPTAGNGIRIVEAINGAAIDPGTFTLSTPTIAVGGYTYKLADVADDVFLQTVNTRPVVSAYVTSPHFAMFMMRNMMGSMPVDHPDMEEEQFKHADLSLGFGGPDMNQLSLSDGVWVRGFTGQETVRTGNAEGSSFSGSVEGMQIGKDIYRQNNPDGSGDHAGVFISEGYGDSTTNSNAGFAGGGGINATAGGAYWTHYWHGGAYVSGMGQYARVTSLHITDTLDNAALGTSGDDFGASAEAGMPFFLGDNTILEPQVQGIYQKLLLEDSGDGTTTVSFRALNAFMTRLGLRLKQMYATNNGLSYQPWIQANLWHTFDQTSAVTLGGTDDFSTPLNGTQMEALIGASLGRHGAHGDGWSVYASGGMERSVGAGPYVTGYTATAGFRKDW